MGKTANPRVADTIAAEDEAASMSAPQDALPEDQTAPTVPVMSAQQMQAERVIKGHMLASLGIGLVPIPALDLALFMGSGALMVRRICAIYGVPFKGNVARSLLAAIGSSLGSAGIATGFGLSMAKLVPGLGTAAALVTLPVANAAFTYAAGKVFIAHFETGGTLLDFNAQSYMDYFRDLFDRGKSVATAMVKRKGKDEAAADGVADTLVPSTP